MSQPPVQSHRVLIWFNAFFFFLFFLSKEPDMGLHPWTLGLWPELKADDSLTEPPMYHSLDTVKNFDRGLHFHFALDPTNYVSPIKTSKEFFLIGGAEGERGKILSRPYTQCGAQCGAWSHYPEIMTWVEIKNQMLNWLSQQGTPVL